MTPKELARVRLARYRAAHPDRVLASYEKYRNSEKGRERNRRWAKSEKGRAYYAAVRAAHTPEQRSAWNAVTHAVERGRLIPEPCAECGKDRAQAHHHLGYKGHELDVIWLCPLHHRRAHTSPSTSTDEGSEVNRHGISLNPTAEESRLLRKLWAGDNARARANRARHEVETLADENARLRVENERLRALLSSEEDGS